MKPLPIGILSGTFDPIHLGHLHLAKTIYKLCHFQKILLIPCYRSPLRTQPIANALDRFNMVKLSASNYPYLIADDREIKNAEISYTIKTLELLRQENPTTSLTLIMGTDVFDRFDEWQDSLKILAFAHLLIAKRPGHWQLTNPTVIRLLNKYQTTDDSQLQKQMAGLIHIVDVNPLPITATEIRMLVKEHKDIKHLVTPEVKQYIDNQHLYL